MQRLRHLLLQNIFLILLVIFYSLLFFYRLGWQTLASWDEAWYASIAREIIRSGDWIYLHFNNTPFYDHPPAGFWMMALTYKLFGISEFTVRLPSAFFGLLSMIFVYLIGVRFTKERVVGFVSAIIVGTCVWYVIRVRSGNLDSIFLFFYVTTIYYALKASAHMKWFPVTMFSFSLLMLTKTLVGASALPIIALILLPQFIKIRKNIIWIISGFLIFIVIVFPWYFYQYKAYSDFIEHHFFKIGTRNKTFNSYFHLQYQLPLFYLHMGVRKWYYLWLISVSYILLFFKFLKKNIFILLMWNVVVLYPFLTTDETSIWHLIPVYVPFAFVMAYGLWNGWIWAATMLKKISIFNRFKKNVFHEFGIKSLYVLGFIIIAVIQIKIFYPEVIPQSHYIPDDVDISMKAAKYSQQIFLDDDYLPIAVYYSGKNMKQMSFEFEEHRTLERLFQTEQNDFIAITRNWALTNLDNNKLPYVVLEKNNSFAIIKKPR